MSADAKARDPGRLHGALSDRPQAPEVPGLGTPRSSRADDGRACWTGCCDYQGQRVPGRRRGRWRSASPRSWGRPARYVIPEGLDTALLPETAARRAMVNTNDGAQGLRADRAGPSNRVTPW
ncbi:hypothetical protein QJS66_18420 [Kocuria rhizophila]|nr:hypothetical protein QJS66_18420 [Kocuria rhizophila]